eukprot:626672-Hanusia_phi.AAC.2
MNINSSAVEITGWEDQVLVFRRVCVDALSRNPGQRWRILFFKGGSEGNGHIAAAHFKKFAREFGAWQSDIAESKLCFGCQALRLADVEVIHGGFSSVGLRKVTATSALMAPHHPDNNFHLLNDFVLPLYDDMLKSGVLKDSRRHLFILHGSSRRFQRRVQMFGVLDQLFEAVEYPFEARVRDSGGLCFEKLVWTQGRIPNVPYYTHTEGRFGPRNSWQGVVPRFREHLFRIFSIHVNDFSAHGKQQSLLAWVPRDCRFTRPRCIVNEDAVLKGLRQKFDVIVLSFAGPGSTLEQTVRQIALTQVLAGMHGAGLAHAVFLRSGSLLVEIKDVSVREKKLFLNMASMQDIAYYMFDAFNEFRTGVGLIFQHRTIEQFRDDLWKAYLRERQMLLGTVDNRSSQCLFPIKLNRTGLSSFEESRCYLENIQGEWIQCVHYHPQCEIYKGQVE